MKFVTQATLFCEGNLCLNVCKKLVYPTFQSKSEMIKEIKDAARQKKWKITRENKAFCPECAKKLGLRGTK